ncbi:MAG: hypothetical protein HY368_01740 [Candidatus Aenigmarchaeota archaeon]|nr:hypothetical protein [Candidatus Aenigmarchaeota archaeon]
MNTARAQDFRSGFDEKKMARLLLMFLILTSVVFLSGCVGGPATTIKSEREVGEAVTNISGDVEDVSRTLDDIDKKFG